MRVSDEQAIRNLLFRYMDATDAGDFETRAELFAHATVWFPEPIGARYGAEVAELFQSRQRLYDGIPRTTHLSTNVIIEIDDDAQGAKVQSRYLVLQETPDFPLQPIIVGRGSPSAASSSISSVRCRRIKKQASSRPRLCARLREHG